ncbi:MAG: hypothetical protein LC802_03510 [Acidobacteria bacterium]|nr:hypothetical protein [Acidobacteriota bacterium]
MDNFFSNPDLGLHDRRSLARVAPTTKMWAAVENTTRNEMLGMAEVTDFSCLGLGLRGVAGDPVAALGDSLWVTLIAHEGIIALKATLVHIKRQNLFGLKVEAPAAPGQHFLLRLYDNALSVTEGTQSPAA